VLDSLPPAYGTTCCMPPSVCWPASVPCSGRKSIVFEPDRLSTASVFGCDSRMSIRRTCATSLPARSRNEAACSVTRPRRVVNRPPWVTSNVSCPSGLRSRCARSADGLVSLRTCPSIASAVMPCRCSMIINCWYSCCEPSTSVTRSSEVTAPGGPSCPSMNGLFDGRIVTVPGAGSPGPAGGSGASASGTTYRADPPVTVRCPVPWLDTASLRSARRHMAFHSPFSSGQPSQDRLAVPGWNSTSTSTSYDTS